MSLQAYDTEIDKLSARMDPLDPVQGRGNVRQNCSYRTQRLASIHSHKANLSA